MRSHIAEIHRQVCAMDPTAAVKRPYYNRQGAVDQSHSGTPIIAAAGNDQRTHRTLSVHEKAHKSTQHMFHAVRAVQARVGMLTSKTTTQARLLQQHQVIG